MGKKKAGPKAPGNMTEQEMDEFMREPAMRGDVIGVTRAAVSDIVQMMDNKFAFVITIMRQMLAASGAMTQDEFNETYQKIVDTFTERFAERDAEAGAAAKADDRKAEGAKSAADKADSPA